ncbi:MAG TPA: crosslink repair DNA glycosylase YcaQ family protein [Candidatus Micrarchaeaceae archaeon]|nr:crosslink repair DNA glycosylase YcaQ family protein [Candidatus Micrarchaeaceae archaeon]
MAPSPRSRVLPQLSLEEARRAAVASQNLLTPAQQVDSLAVTEMVKRIGYLQRDPISVVAPSHLLVLWSRLGNFDRALVERALWHERSLFEYWAHGASIIPTADFSAHLSSMRAYGRGDRTSDRRRRSWIDANHALRRQILSRLRQQGPQPAAAFDGEPRVTGPSTGWGGERDVERMLFHLWRAGTDAIAGRDARGRVWELTERWLGAPGGERKATAGQLTERMAERSLRALGVATEIQIRGYMGAGRHGRLTAVLERLERRGSVVQVTVKGAQGLLPGKWWTHREDLDSAPLPLGRSPWSTTLLSPFDNLLIDRSRTATLFDFDFRMEIYVPPQLRRYGYYVLSILHRDRLIGRVDLRRDRARGRLVAVAVHGEPGAPSSAEVGRGISDALHRLAEFVGVGEVEVGQLVSAPSGWGPPLRR